VLLERVERIEQAPKRIVDLVRHARGQPTERGQAFFLGHMHGQCPSLALGLDQRIVAFEKLPEVVALGGKSRLWNRADLAGASLP
jgi:hypothetical protein